MIVAHALTDATVDDATTGVELIEAVNGPLTRVTADGAYDTVAFYDAAGARGARVVVPPVRLEFPILSLNPGRRQRCVPPIT